MKCGPMDLAGDEPMENATPSMKAMRREKGRAVLGDKRRPGISKGEVSRWTPRPGLPRPYIVSTR